MGANWVPAAITLGHDTLIGVVLFVADALTIAFVRSGAQNLRLYTVGGAVATIVIGALLLLGLV